MRWTDTWRLRLRSLVRHAQVEQELDEELRYHRERLEDDYVAAGLPRREARYRALRDMGAIEPRKEECRDTRGLAIVDSVRQDVAYALRAMRKSPGFSTVAILSLAIGIAANTTIFTFVNAVLLRPLPFPDSGRLVVVHEHLLDSSADLAVHPANFVEWRARARSLESLALVQSPPLNVLGSSGAEQLARLLTTAEVFQVFAVTPVLGRGFLDEDSLPGAAAIVILGHGYWQRAFGGDPRVLGRQLATPDGSLTIVGVAPAGFRIGLREPDVFTPMTIDPGRPAATGSRAFECYGRLARGSTLAAANAEMSAIAATLRPQHRYNERMGVRVSSLHEFLARDASAALRLLMTVAAVVLTIACVNLAGLLIARSVNRRGELAMRAALGAGRGRLVRQLVIESLVLALCAAVAGTAMAYWATQSLLALTAGALTAGISEPIRLDTASLIFTLVVSTTTALAFGLMPARDAGGIHPQSVLREQGRGTTADGRQHRLRKILVVTEVALAVVLLVGAGLLLRTFSTLSSVDLGFEPRGKMTMGLFLGMRPPEVRSAALERILDNVGAVPGVRAAGAIQFLPLRGIACGTGFWREEHAAAKDPAQSLPTECSVVTRGYFEAMGIPLVAGRVFDRRDGLSAPRVLMVSQSFAQRYYPDGRALGRRILVQSSNQLLAEIVGVVGDIRHNGLTTDPAPTVYLLHAQTPAYLTNLVVRTDGDPAAQAAALRRAIHEADPAQAASVGGTLEQDVDKLLSRPRLQATLVTVFAAIAIVLAVIGVYGLVSYVATLRTHEIGIRLALGASRKRVFLDLFGEGARLVLGGLALGILAAFALRQLVAGFVFGVTAGDPFTYALAALTFAAIGLAAVLVPAHRASRTEPVRALRLE